MTFGAASWLIYPFRFLLGRPSHRQSVHGPRRTSPRLDPLESRELLSSSADVWNFVTAPRLHPMKVSVQVQEPGTVAGLIFVGPYAVSQSSSDLVGQTGPLIMDNSGNPVWFLPVSSTNKKQVTDFRVQSYLGQPVLTWWQGTIAGTVPSDLPNGTALPGARFYIYNDHYQKIMTVKARNGFTADVHEFLITPQGDALFLATKVVKANLTPYGGVKHGAFVDFEVQEINLRSGKLVFAWDMAKHVPLSASIVPAPTSASQVWDAYHLNSIDEGQNGALLLSARTHGQCSRSVTPRYREADRSSGSSAVSRRRSGTSSASRMTSQARMIPRSNGSTMHSSNLSPATRRPARFSSVCSTTPAVNRPTQIRSARRRGRS